MPMAAKAPAEDVQRVVAAALDLAFYRAVNPDLPPDIGPITHYCRYGWREGRDPAPWFSVRGYLDAHPDVRKARTEPFAHYLAKGRWEGREIVPSRHRTGYLRAAGWSTRQSVEPPIPNLSSARPPGPASGPLPSLGDQRAAVAREFDADFYLAANPDIGRSGMAPLDHFMAAGWREGRDPHPKFSMHDYLEANPDVVRAGLNPFAHFVLAGRHEGRAGRHDRGFRYDLIARMRSPGARIRDAALEARRIRPAPAGQLAGKLAAAHTELSQLHLTFSHDDYVAHMGGVQLCLRRESARVRGLGYDHLHLYPATPWPAVRADTETGQLGVLLNGTALGVFAAQAVADVLAQLRRGRDTASASLAIHSLTGHAVEETISVVRAAGLCEGFFWLHDFGSLCAGVHLLRDDVEDCAAPPAESAACGVCAYGPHRARHLDAHRRLFEALALTVVAPASVTLDLWRSRADLPVAGARILPHARLVAHGAAMTQGDTDGGEGSPFRLAFLGMPTALKGWAVFRTLAEQFADDPRYDFVHLGGQADPRAPAAFHRIVLSEAEPEVMQNTLADLRVDAALIWPLCRETFSFTAYEAAAGGSAVITWPDSGNVAAFVRDHDMGQVLADEAALTEAFTSGAVLRLARHRRAARRHELVYSGMTGDLLADPSS